MQWVLFIFHFFSVYVESIGGGRGVHRGWYTPVYRYHSVCVAIRGQFVGIGSFLPPGGRSLNWDLSFGHQPRGQVVYTLGPLACLMVLVLSGVS